MKYAFAGDRQISVKILTYLIEKQLNPSALFVSNAPKASHSNELIKISKLPNSLIFLGDSFKDSLNIEKLKALDLDYIIGIHFAYIIPQNVLDIPKIGFINLHPAYLPYNKGWHTPSWAIYNNEPYGATLHFMTEKLDMGNIIHNKKIEILPNYNANELYQKTLDLEFEVFKEALPELLTLNPANFPQNKQEGSVHNKKDLQEIQEIDLYENVSADKIITKLRALTTNDINEAAYFYSNNEKYAIQIKIQKL